MIRITPVSEDPVKRVTARGLILAGIISVVLSLTVSNPTPIVKGFLLGAVINLLNFRLMSLAFVRMSTMPVQRVQGYAMAQYMIRYSIYGLVLFLAFRSPTTNGIATACGYFLVKGIILADTVIQRVQEKTQKKGGS